MKGLIGRKVGMTQIFTEEGRAVPVTVIEAGPCPVVQARTAEKEGYPAVQLGFGPQKETRVTKPLQGHFKRGGAAPHRVLREFRFAEGDDLPGEGETLTVDMFEDVDFIDVVALSKGRGYQGVVKRHGFSGGRASHGSGMHRMSGSIGMCEKPARVMKNRKMPGQTGARRVTTQNLRVMGVRTGDNVLLVRGAVPGPNNGIVEVREARKKQGRKAS
ncbi:50S ribosomal protein L3 [Kiritimatiella glycovorans]|uniref:Large ribosomal subunit protein uL3 n=1 Tax=Kiritimatiella glycovorans TaxID=1307763 RepID=A0A0G3EHQ6_9BACT|nr:50S ribosomal protein L3 [Kiritimatiella glycovorans]AKJ64957.1 50S ribosomal protein L3 [Kiritimatiella glycovorans]